MTRKIKVRNISVSKSKTVNNRCQLALNNEFLASSKDWVSHANNLIEISVKITSKEIIITPPARRARRSFKFALTLLALLCGFR